MSTSVIAELCLYLLTWNVGTEHPNDISLTNLLGLNGTTNCPNGHLPDIYAITLQEVSTKPKNQVLNLFQDDAWTFKVRDALNDYEYVKVETEQLQGILIMIFAQRQHIPHMKSIESKSTRTGLGGIWGNKGAVSVRMSLYGTGVTFVGSHLAAHDAKLKERIEDYNAIVNNHHYEAQNYRSIFDHDFVFWFGDLNFRLTGDDSAWDVRGAVENGRLAELYERDQLVLVRETGNAFSLMKEEVPTFPPTFKFNEGTSEYNLKRRPAWCDRIMYRVQENKYPYIKLSLQQLSYMSHQDYVLSDHKPVTAEFLFKIETESDTDQELHEKTHGASDSVEF